MPGLATEARESNPSAKSVKESAPRRPLPWDRRERPGVLSGLSFVDLKERVLAQVQHGQLIASETQPGGVNVFD